MTDSWNLDELDHINGKITYWQSVRDDANITIGRLELDKKRMESEQ